MASPDYFICLECETPCYSFEWEEGKLSEILCPVCGNDDPEQFALPEEIDEMTES
jgi:transcription initiation factor IIE alpha subunit